MKHSNGKLQNRAASIITGSGWDVRSAQVVLALRRESLADRRAKQLKSLMFKIANNIVPEYLSNKLISIPSIDIILGAPNITCSFRGRTLKKSFRYRGAVTLNSLSVEATQATTFNSIYSVIAD